MLVLCWQIIFLHRSLLATTRGEKNLREKLEATEALLDRATREVEKLNSALALSSTETEQLRVYYEQLRRKDLSEIEALLHELGQSSVSNLRHCVTLCHVFRCCKGSKLGLERRKEGN